jgi:hypothetical protein
VLSQQRGQREMMELAAAAQFDTGFYRSIRFTAADGSLGFTREALAHPLHAPAWFVALAPIESTPGVAQVSDGWRALGSIEVVSQTAFAHDELWRGSLRAAFALAVVGALAGLLAALGVGRIRAARRDGGAGRVAAARRIPDGDRAAGARAATPDARDEFDGRAAARRLRGAGRAGREHAPPGELRHADRPVEPRPLHGAAGAALKREDGPASGGLILLRVLDLADLNRRLGREATDRMIRTIAQTLQAYTQRVGGAFVGRLNGSDFALALPEGGISDETARRWSTCCACAARVRRERGGGRGRVETRHGEELGR